MNAERFAGCMTALVTPFRNGRVDVKALELLVTEQLEAGIHGLVPCGSTGEAATMTREERCEVIRTVVKQVKGKVPVIAGTGSNNTVDSIEMSKLAQDEGVDAVMCVAPYYNKPTQDGMLRHFETIADAVNIPVVLYNVPGRTGSSLLPATVIRLSKHDRIIAIKDASGGVENTIETLLGNPDFVVLSGDDGMFVPFLSVGARGLISVASNVMPGKLVAVYDAWRAGDPDGARKEFYSLWPLFKAMFFESNPIPVKAALGLMEKIDPTPRLPLTLISQENLARLKKALEQVGALP